MSIFDTLESEVRSYCRTWPVTFTHAAGTRLRDENGRSYLDFFAGAGALNYGHNNPALKQALLDYLQQDGIVQSLDMHTTAKAEFLQTFHDIVLEPRGLDYKVMFPGPTGTNSVEAALKLARKVTGRCPIVAFTNAFHGMTLGSLAVTGNSFKRTGAGIPLGHTVTMPYDGYPVAGRGHLGLLDALLTDPGSGVDKPAAVIIETVQGEGGINLASPRWLRELSELCKRHDVLLIVDDVQMGCGRTGTFFSFEEAGITPDIVCLSKSIGGYGMPMALTLFRRELDCWEPGEHNGTFRGHNPSFVTASAALRTYWIGGSFEDRIAARAQQTERTLRQISTDYIDVGARIRGRGLAWGLTFDDTGLAGKICAAAFDSGLLMETAGPRNEVVKLFPPLTITDMELREGLDILSSVMHQVNRLGD